MSNTVTWEFLIGIVGHQCDEVLFLGSPQGVLGVLENAFRYP